MKAKTLNQAGERIATRRAKAKARKDFAQTMAEGAFGHLVQPDFEPMKAKSFSWPLARTRLGFTRQPRERLPDDQIAGLIVTQQNPPTDTDHTRPQPTAIVREVLPADITRHSPQSPNNGKRDKRVSVRVRHSVVDGRWKYVTVKRYGWEKDEAGDRLGGSDRKRARQTINANDGTALPVKLVKKSKDLKRHDVHSLPIPAKSELTPAELELLAKARDIDAVLCEGLAEGLSDKDIGQRYNPPVSKQAVAKRRAKLVETMLAMG